MKHGKPFVKYYPLSKNFRVLKPQQVATMVQRPTTTHSSAMTSIAPISYILSDSAVKAVLINIFGGIVSCATIAEGIIGAVQEVGVEVPVVVRFEGNNSALGRQTLADSGLNIIPGESLVDAVEKAVAAAGGQA